MRQEARARKGFSAVSPHSLLVSFPNLRNFNFSIYAEYTKIDCPYSKSSQRDGEDLGTRLQESLIPGRSRNQYTNFEGMALFLISNNLNSYFFLLLVGNI